MTNSTQKYPPLEEVTRPNLSTAELAFYSNMAAQTWRMKACYGTAPAGLHPLRVCGKLAWPTAGAKKLLTERTEHLDAIASALNGNVPTPFVLHGRMSKKQRAALIAELDALPPDVPRILLATGKLVGEGFDHHPLDTLVLAMPISWKGTLQQYAGRLHREHATKTDVRILDFVDTGHPALLRMWDKRRRGYKAMGYRISLDEAGDISTQPLNFPT